MRILAIEKELPGITSDEFAIVAEAEALRVWELIQEGLIREMDPIDKLEDYPEKPLLLMGGEEDPVVNRKYILDLYNKLDPHYEEYPDRLGLRLF